MLGVLGKLAGTGRALAGFFTIASSSFFLRLFLVLLLLMGEAARGLESAAIKDVSTNSFGSKEFGAILTRTCLEMAIKGVPC